AAAVQGHDRHGRVVQHGLDAAVRLVHRLGDGPGDLGHGQAVVRVAEFGVDLRQLLLGSDDRGTGVLQPGGQVRFCHHKDSSLKSWKIYVCASTVSLTVTKVNTESTYFPYLIE